MRRLFATILLVLLCPLYAEARSEADIEELKRVQDQTSKTLADTVQTLNQIRQELQQLRGEVEENSHTVREQTEKNEKLLREFDFRLTGIEERFQLFVQQLEEIRSLRGKHGETEAAAYRKGLTAVNLQDYKGAIAAFDQFLAKYPNSTLADNAQYWKGEAYYAMKDYQKAVVEFQAVVKKYPKSDKVPGALLKQGYSFYELQSYLDAKAFLSKLTTEFPKSEEADAARERLAKIDQVLAKGPATTTAPAQPK